MHRKPSVPRLAPSDHIRSSRVLQVCAFHVPPLVLCEHGPGRSGGFEEELWLNTARAAGLAREAWEKICVSDVEEASSRAVAGECDLILSAPVRADLMQDLRFTEPTFSGNTGLMRLPMRPSMHKASQSCKIPFLAVLKRHANHVCLAGGIRVIVLRDAQETMIEFLGLVFMYARFFDWPLLASILACSAPVALFIWIFERCSLTHTLHLLLGKMPVSFVGSDAEL